MLVFRHLKMKKLHPLLLMMKKNFYHCFATSEHGNIFDFVMKTQNFKFGEAVRHLANLAGMQPYIFSKQDEEREKKVENILIYLLGICRLLSQSTFEK